VATVEFSGQIENNVVLADSSLDTRYHFSVGSYVPKEPPRDKDSGYNQVPTLSFNSARAELEVPLGE
jgi:hypothetical protein